MIRVQLTRSQADKLELREGQPVFLDLTAARDFNGRHDSDIAGLAAAG